MGRKRTRMDLVNAVTFAAHQTEGIGEDRRQELESKGGGLLTMAAREFATIATAV